MKIEVSEIEYCKLKVNCEADANEVSDERLNILTKFKDTTIPGFRPGKAPIEAIKHTLKDKIEEFTKNELAHSAFLKAVGEKNLKPFGQPEFSSLNLKDDHFDCEFVLLTLPSVELKKYKELEIPKPGLPSIVEMAEKTLQELRIRNGETLPFTDDDFLQLNDQAILNIKGSDIINNDISFEKEGVLHVMNNSAFSLFDENILGMKIGESRSFTIMIPADYIPQEMANKEVKFTVELVMGSKLSPAALDDELAKKLNVENIQKLIDMTQGAASARVQELEKRYLSEQVGTKLLKEHAINVPNWLALFEGKLYAKQHGHNWENLNDDEKLKFLEIAKRNIKLSIILDKIRENEPEAQLSDEEVINMVKRNLPFFQKDLPNMSNKSEIDVLQAINDKGYMPILLAHIKNDFTIDFIIKNSTIVE